jgi:hypothetical protein
VKIDPDTTWVRASRIIQIVVATGAFVGIYMHVTHSIARLEETVSRDAAQRVNERENIVRSVNEVRDELRNVFVDTVLARQAQGWIELARALNKDKYPNLVWPDLPR